jgi:AcrR family transcriptional regulator
MAAVEEMRRYGGVAGRRRASDRRISFLESGRLLWASQGIGGVTVRKVCAVAGVTDRYFYQEFGGLNGFLVAVAQGVYDELNAAMISTMRLAPGLRETLSRGLAGFIEELALKPHALPIVMTESPTLPELAAVRLAAQDRVVDQIVAVIRNHADWPADVGDVEERARFVVGGVTATLARWAQDPKRTSRHKVTEQVVQYSMELLGV